jgi:hypothetical protein
VKFHVVVPDETPIQQGEVDNLPELPVFIEEVTPTPQSDKPQKRR